jgi:Flp pilus assembly protein TadD
MGRFSLTFWVIPILLVGCRGTTDSSVVDSAKPASKAMALDTKFSIARVREQQGKLSMATSILKKLCEADPKNAAYAHRYGIVQCRLGDFQAGLKWLSQADSLDPDSPAILSDLGFACMMTGRIEQASEILETALEVDPQNVRAVNNLALTHGYMGNFDQAHKLFLTNMTEAEAMSNLGYVAAQVGKKDFAIQCYSRAIDLDPDLKKAKEGLLQLAELDQRIQERKAIARESRNPGNVIQASAEVIQASAEKSAEKPTVQQTSVEKK